MTSTSRLFPHFALRGTHREVGRQHGEAVRDLIRGHLDLILRQASRKSGLTRESSLRWAQAFAPEYMRNTRARQARMEALTDEARGRLDAERLKACLADHANAPDSICAHKGERPPYFESYTFASVVASLDERRLDVAVGPPCRNVSVSYRLNG